MSEYKMLFLTLVFFVSGAFIDVWGQKVYKVEYASQADIKVFPVKYESQSDLKVFRVRYESEADEPGLWFFTDYESQAGWKKNQKVTFLIKSSYS